MGSDEKIEEKILNILSKEIMSISQLARRLKIKRYLLSGYLEALKDQGKVESFVVGRAKVYVAKEKIKKSISVLVFFLILPMFLFSNVRGELITSFYPSDGVGWVVKFNNELRYYNEINATINCSSAPQVLISGTGSNYIPTVRRTSNNTWSFSLYSYLLSPRDYNLLVSCQDTTETLPFSIKKIEISFDQPTDVYEGVYVKLTFNIDSDIGLSAFTFSHSINSSKASILTEIQSNKLSAIISNLTSGTYLFTLGMSYSSFNINFPVVFKVLPRYEFRISHISRNYVESGENITLNVYVSDSGRPIEISKENLKVYLEEEQVEILALRFDGSNNVLRISIPSLNPGVYNLKVVANLDRVYSDTVKVYYVRSIYGSLVDSNKKPIFASFYLYKDGQEIFRNTTDSYGNYLIRLVPDKYDLKIVLPQSSLYFYDFSFSSNQNFFSYNYQDSLQIEGLKVYGIYFFEVSGIYSKVDVKLNYKESNVEDEDFINLFYCDSWNHQKSLCNKDWVKMENFVLDKTSNTVSFSTNSLSAFVLGREKYTKVLCNSNKNKFYVDEVALIQCLVQDEDGNSIKDATATIKIDGKTIVRKTNEKGIVSFEVGLENEGNISFSVFVKKDPFIASTYNSSIYVERKKEVFILIPDTIRIEQGNKANVEFTIFNTGQTDLNNLELYLDGVGFNYTFNQTFIERIKPGESVKNFVTISVRENATLGVSTIKIRMISDELNYSKEIGLTILENRQNYPTGLFIKITSIEFKKEYFYLLIFAAASFFLSFLLKKIKKLRKQKRDYSDVFNLIGGVK